MIRFVNVVGPDSESFLSRVTAGTVKGVPEGSGRRGLLLTGQSRVVAQFDLLHLAKDRFRLAVPEECASALADGLEALHFSEDLTIAVQENQTAGLRPEPAASGEQGLFSLLTEGSWPAPVPGWAFDSSSHAWSAEWEWDRIGALVPWPKSEWDSSTPALEAGMLPWIDRYKGCYPGQEVVELSLNVGHPARVLVAVEGDVVLVAGKRIPWGESEVLVTSVAAKGGRYRALVRVPWAGRLFLPSDFVRLASHW